MCEYFRQACALKEVQTNNSVIPAMPKTRHRQETPTGRMIMHIKSILAGATIALAATIGSASAADQFATLGGIPAASMSAGEMAVVRGEGAHSLFIHMTLPAGAMGTPPVLHGAGVSTDGINMMNDPCIGLCVATVGPAMGVLHWAPPH